MRWVSLAVLGAVYLTLSALYRRKLRQLGVAPWPILRALVRLLRRK